MALRFLANHRISNSIVQTLPEANHEVLCLREVLPAESSKGSACDRDLSWEITRGRNYRIRIRE